MSDTLLLLVFSSPLWLIGLFFFGLGIYEIFQEKVFMKNCIAVPGTVVGTVGARQSRYRDSLQEGSHHVEFDTIIEEKISVGGFLLVEYTTLTGYTYTERSLKNYFEVPEKIEVKYLRSDPSQMIVNDYYLVSKTKQYSKIILGGIFFLSMITAILIYS